MNPKPIIMCCKDVEGKYKKNIIVKKNGNVFRQFFVEGEKIKGNQISNYDTFEEWIILFWITHPTRKLGALSKRDSVCVYDIPSSKPAL